MIVNEQYVPPRDERELNVAKKIRELSSCNPTCIEDSSTEDNELKRLRDELISRLSNSPGDYATLSQTLNEAVQEINTINQTLSDVTDNLNGIDNVVANLQTNPVIRKSSNYAEFTGGFPITTASLYTTLKNSLGIGDIFIGEVNISDGPVGPSENLGIFAYATTGNITDGDSVYSRVYILATEKTVAPYFWYYNTGVWRSIMLMEDYENFKIRSNTPGSNKKFVITVDDSGTLHATEIVVG